jgi:hypothetical protein
MVDIPAQWVAAGQGVPDVCARHGQLAVQRRPVRLISRPPVWALPLIVFGVLVYALVALAVRKTVIAPAWPFCAQCLGARRRQRRIGLVLLGLTTLSALGAIVLVGPLHNDAGGLGFLLALLLMLAAIFVFGSNNWVLASRARVSRDGNSVQVKGCAAFDHAALDVQRAVWARQQAAFAPAQSPAGYAPPRS